MFQKPIARVDHVRHDVDMPPLEPGQIIQWFRDKSAEFSRIADSLETTFPGGSTRHAPQQIDQKLGRELSVSDILAVVGDGKFRVKDIARKMNTDNRSVERVISTNPDSFETGNKGWMTLKRDN